MANVAFKLAHAEPSYRIGIVIAVEGGEIVVRTDEGDLAADRATSCLVAPTEGDEVALLLAGDGRAFVTAVLVRDGAGPVEIAVNGDLHLSAQGGSCRISATEGVEVAAEGTVSLKAKLLSLRAEDGSVVLSRLTVLASTILAHTEGGRVAAKAFDWVCDRFSSTVQRSYRTVEDLDQVRAGRIDYRTEEEMCLRSENFLVGARNLAKLDAEQIHLG